MAEENPPDLITSGYGHVGLRACRATGDGWRGPRESRLTLSGAVFRVARVMHPRQFLLLLPAGLLLGLASSCSRSPSPPTAEPAPAALGIGLAAPIPLE